MILGGDSVLLKSPGRFLGGSTLSGYRSNWGKPGAARNRFFGQGATSPYLKIAATPNGYQAPGAWVIAMTSGGVSSYRQSIGVSTVAGNVAGGVYRTAAIAGTTVITALVRGKGVLVVAIVGTTAISALLRGVASLSAGFVGVSSVSALLRGKGVASCAIAGNSTVTASARLGVFAIASIAGLSVVAATARLAAFRLAAISGTSVVSGVTNAIFPAIAALSGAGTVAALLRGRGVATTAIAGHSTVALLSHAVSFSTADTGTTGGISPTSIAAAVWSQVLGTPPAGTAGGDLVDILSDTAAIAAAVDPSGALSIDVTLLRKALVNRMEASAGSPGSLVLYDDDGTTPLLTWDLRDETGGPVLPTVGAPSRRGAGT